MKEVRGVGVTFGPNYKYFGDGFSGFHPRGYAGPRRTEDVYYITRGLVKGCLSFARDRDPGEVTLALAVTPAGELEGSTDLQSDTPVFTHFYMPTDDSVSAVFGLDLATPRSQGRFVSHPDGREELTSADDLHEVVFLAVPPYEEVTAFDRRGRQRSLRVLDVEPPTETVGHSER
jgi:hypothetical protein